MAQDVFWFPVSSGGDCCLLRAPVLQAISGKKPSTEQEIL
jgi:hypothetical protein